MHICIICIYKHDPCSRLSPFGTTQVRRTARGHSRAPPRAPSPRRRPQVSSLLNPKLQPATFPLVPIPGCTSDSSVDLYRILLTDNSTWLISDCPGTNLVRFSYLLYKLQLVRSTVARGWNSLTTRWSSRTLFPLNFRVLHDQFAPHQAI